MKLTSALAEARIPWLRAQDALREDLAGDDGFAAAAQSRREDLLVHFALMQFPGSPKYRHLPQSIQADIRSFFGKHASAQDESRRLLFATGDRDGIRADSETGVVAGLAGKRGDRHIRFRSSVLPRLPPRLRVLVGSAEVLQGGVDACDFVEINLDAPRITMITCDDVSKAIPFVVENIRVDLGRRKVTFDRRVPGSVPLYFKSRYLPPDDADRERQTRIDAALRTTGLFPEGAPEPSWEVVRAKLAGPGRAGCPAEPRDRSPLRESLRPSLLWPSPEALAEHETDQVFALAVDVNALTVAFEIWAELRSSRIFEA